MKVAIIIGRFQDETVCQRMDSFISKVRASHDKTMLLLGLSPIKATKDNPLDFETRKLMIQSEYPNLQIGYIKDSHDDGLWSQDVDEQVKKFAKGADVTIYGGEFTVLNVYNGKYNTEALPNETYVNSELERKRVASNVKETADFRAGVIWATQNQYPKVYPTVDVAVFKDGKLLLARKPNEALFRFIGGFVDPNEKFSVSAKREVKEEANIDVYDVEYIDTFVIPDWRYKGTCDCITTTLFIAKYGGGVPKAQDDIAELKWSEHVSEDEIVPEHRELLRELIDRSLIYTPESMSEFDKLMD